MNYAPPFHILSSTAGRRAGERRLPRDGGCHVEVCSGFVFPVEQAVLIVFADLTRFMVNSRRTPDAALAELLDGYYRHADGLVSAVLKRDIDTWWAAKGWDSRVVVKAHFGRAVIGPFGTDARFDVIGNEVNVAATLPARTVSLSAEAFRCLENGKRRAFRKHTAIRGLDRHDPVTRTNTKG